MKLTYPLSRTSANSQCKECRGHPGTMVAGTPFNLGGVQMLPVTCDYCGSTKLFNLDVVRAAPYRQDGTEEDFPY